jgi:assimilatory nitrate reductase catalytic subunit
MNETRTTCPYCGVGCGVLLNVDDDGTATVRGDPQHPSNFGRLCSKGAALGETVGLDGRLLYPQIHGRRVSWDAALDHVAAGFRRIIDQYGPDAVAFYVSGQLLTEDYYVANKLMKGFIGSANIDTNSRLCMSSSVVGHKRAFGSDTVPGCYEDLEQAELLVLVGSNTAWCHPVLFQRIRAAKEQHPERKLIVIDPRRTATCDIADLHLPLKSGSDAILFNGLLSYLFHNGRVDFDYLERATEGYGRALQTACASAPSIPVVAAACGVAEEDVARFYHLFAATERVVSVYSQGVNQSSSGSDKVNAIINCHLATGRIGRPGMGPFSVTGQPNAMGGREVGGLANQLAAHMDFDDPRNVDRVRRFWRAPNMAVQAGLKAVDMFRAVDEGRIRAVWIMATNPVVSLPDADRVRAALRKCELVVVSDCVANTDTTDCAHVLLPAAAWGEKDGTVTNSERRISRQRTFLPPPGEARPDWWIVTEVAGRLGYAEAFSFTNPAQIFREHAALSGYENGGSRDFDLSALAQTSDESYGRLQPVQWPVTAAQPRGTARMFGDGRYFTPGRKARFIAVDPRPPVNGPDDDYPMVLNTGRVRDHWHTLTRTGKSPRLSAHTLEPYAELHPRDAARLRIDDGALVRLRSRWGWMIARAAVSEGQRPGNVFVPMHWNEQFAARGRVDALVNPETDPDSGQPESKHTPVKVEPYTPKWYGFLISRRCLKLPPLDYWVMAVGRQFSRYELAGETLPEDWGRWARDLLCTGDGAPTEWVEYLDSAAGRYRGARLVGDRLDGCLFVATDPSLPPRSWLGQLFGQESLSSQDRMSLLVGTPPKDRPDGGRVVCSCFGVGINTLTRAIRGQGLTTAEAVGRALKAGTNCGSCIPELKALIKETGLSKVS